MIPSTQSGHSHMKSTAAETLGVAGIWGAYWQSHTANEFLQTVALLLGIIGSILYILVMWKKLTNKNEKEGD